MPDVLNFYVVFTFIFNDASISIICVRLMNYFIASSYGSAFS